MLENYIIILFKDLFVIIYIDQRLLLLPIYVSGAEGPLLPNTFPFKIIHSIYHFILTIISLYINYKIFHLWVCGHK